MMNKYAAELLGTFWLVMGGCGTAILSGFGVGLLGISLAFGLSVLTMAYAVGHVSGAHFNPAVTLGVWAAGRFPSRDVLPYMLAQVAGGLLAGGALYLIAAASSDFDLVGSGFAANGYGEHSPGDYPLLAALICEVLMTAMFLLIILGVTSGRAPTGFAPLAIGLALTLIHLISIPVTNTSVNPARSTAVAFYVGGWAIEQLWLFWLAPLLGAVLGAGCHRLIGRE
ncbi:Aquaporin Z [Pseudomonas sp. THAF187a]|nr:Aquaporin Z [Pseudomonas sp. THAF187a]QFT44114.1 Aquaporin Z [Pseudomonas sp. THAF42]